MNALAQQSTNPANDAVTDQAGAERSGEELPLARLIPWIEDQLGDVQGAPQVTQYSGGASNWTYRLQYANADLILRRPPAGTKARSAHDMGREYRLQKALVPTFPLVPTMRAYSDDKSIIGAEFYLMDRLEGIIPRRNLPRGITLTDVQAGDLCRTMLDTLVSLHHVDYQAVGLDELGAGAGYARRQVDGWSRRYRQARTWNVPRGTHIMNWLSENLPSKETLCVTHNDFRLDNLVLDRHEPTRIIGVLDWELATIGDPFMDLGNLLAYWIQADDDRIARGARRQPTTLPGMLSRAEVIDYYCEQLGQRPDNLTFYEVYGLFRLSVIAQQIYYRYHHRQTRNRAFRHFWFFVHYLHRRCIKAIRHHA